MCSSLSVLFHYSFDDNSGQLHCNVSVTVQLQFSNNVHVYMSNARTLQTVREK